MHYQGFPTSNHYGATADGLGTWIQSRCTLLYQDSIQYHPTGAIYPVQIFGALVTEKVRSVGAQLVNANGEAYIHPLETRDVNASGVIRECAGRPWRRGTRRTERCMAGYSNDRDPWR